MAWRRVPPPDPPTDAVGGPTVDDAKIENVLLGEAVIQINREVVIEAVRRYLGAL